MKRPTMQVEEIEPRTIQRADVAPADGFSLIVDGHFKTRHESEAAARAAGTELLGRFPMLQILVYDAATRVRSPLK
ncbi:hypothetical protein [Bradyrhizobium symbiodeficiens]|uniref:BON domain-containing protein n=2 Tax=Bradyrhizobium symbiodeficiens TaxID=1404367 RepID=A0ABX5W1L7_9BRAD|nr:MULTISPECIES: hypothetical protein [Bradyrhizobium]AWM05728.1 hypothetical protein CIT39_04150 [Bradyrhizobium symbiodeficiens]QDF36109.1 hypothetical protein FJN17_00165 [Bradyrhizobium symbiodeficiens]QIO98694.1 hypothetical protein HAU86_02175 [Bradyrhizobium symbiodeficiens]QIP05647.1 hypothetical protein HAV00_05010 [Bradyrhizobium symbiodeficiens]UPJ60172.1 hypothetical protein IVB24_11300 [Bradyrhizobium sp. 192]